jgi:hypothetical protein
MNNVELCILLNIIILVVSGYEICKDLDVIEDKHETPARRRKYALRFALSTVTVCASLIIIYTILGVSTNDVLGVV